MVRDTKEKNVSNIIKSVAKNYLSLDLEELGVVKYENILNSSINNMAEYLIGGKDTVARGNFYDIAYNIVRNSRTYCPTFPTAATAMQQRVL